MCLDYEITTSLLSRSLQLSLYGRAPLYWPSQQDHSLCQSCKNFSLPRASEARIEALLIVSLTANDAEEEFQIPDETLSPRLRREHGWSEAFTDRALEGYRQFMKLKILQEDWDAEKLSPSVVIDRVWHAHILDTKSYARACDAYAGRMIHHNPDGGLNQEERLERIKITQATLIGLCGNKFDKEVWSFGEDSTRTSSNENKRRRIDTVADEVEEEKKDQEDDSEADLITIILEDETRTRFIFKIRRTAKLQKLFEEYARRKGVKNINDLRFLLDGDRMLPYQMPVDLEMEDHDEIDVMTELSAC